MRRKIIPLLVIGLSGLAWLPIPQRAIALTPLTRAVIRDIYNLVQLMPQNRPRRKARLSDAMTPGDGLSTGRYSLAELRFNDGSLARVGEQAIFRFLPRTRNFNLNNGTVLLLIPPGQGRTRVRTPSAATTIRGSALFIRYDSKTDTTIVGALTNSGIEVFDKKESKSRVLKAGQMMVVVKGELRELYDFDLRHFYETSDLVKDLPLTHTNPTINPDVALDSVRAETTAALQSQKPIVGEGVIQNPAFIELSSPSQSVARELPSTPNPLSVDLLSNADSIQPDNRRENRRERGGSAIPNPTPPLNPSQPPISNPPSNQPQTPSQPPISNPPSTQPPDSTPPITQPETPPPPPETPEPPVTQPPDSRPPVNQPPDSRPPVTQPETPPPPPETPEPPVIEPPDSTPPVTQPETPPPPPVETPKPPVTQPETPPSPPDETPKLPDSRPPERPDSRPLELENRQESNDSLPPPPTSATGS